MTNPLYFAPVMHPAAILRGRWALEPAQIATLRKARDIAAGAPPPWTEDALRSAMESAILFPTLEDLRLWKGDLYSHPNKTVAVDIECAGPHLVRVGFCRLFDRSVLGVPFRLKGGAPAYEFAALERVVEWLDELLANPAVPKWFHNGQAFDIPYLQRLGFEIANYAGDTMLLQRYMFPEMPASLQFVAALYANFPAWKHIANEDDEDADK